MVGIVCKYVVLAVHISHSLSVLSLSVYVSTWVTMMGHKKMRRRETAVMPREFRSMRVTGASVTGALQKKSRFLQIRILQSVFSFLDYNVKIIIIIMIL